MAVLREAIAGMLARSTNAVKRRSGSWASTCRWSQLEIPEIHFTEAQAMIGADTGEDLRARTIWRPPTSGGWASGRSASTARSSYSSPATRWQTAVLHPSRPGPARRLEQLRPPVPRARARHRRPAAASLRGLRGRASTARSDRSPTPATSRHSGTACHRTVASRSASNAGSPGSPARPTSAKPRCSPRPEPTHALTQRLRRAVASDCRIVAGGELSRGLPLGMVAG